MKKPSFLTKEKIIHLLINRYFLIGVGFVLLILLSQNNIIYSYRLHKQLRDLKETKQMYQDQIKQDSVNILKLRTDSHEAERYGREKYMMKKDNEDIFIIR